MSMKQLQTALKPREWAWSHSDLRFIDVSTMKAIPAVRYPSPDELAARILDREVEAYLLPPGTARQSVLIEVGQLRAYADVKWWLASPK